MNRRVTRRTLLAGAGLATAAVAGVEVARQMREPAAPVPNEGFFLGLNVSGLETPVVNAPTPEMIDVYASYGVRRLRLPGLWEYFQPEPNGPLDPDYLKVYLKVVDEAARRGMTVLIEPCHNYGGRRIGETEHKIGDGTLTIDMLVDFWRRFVEATGEVAAIDGWDIMEEPGDLPPGIDGHKTWFAAAQATVDAIRDLGEERPITVEVYSPGSVEIWSRLNTELYTVTDPLDRLIFSNHVFLDSNNSGTRPHWETELETGDQFGGGALTYDVGVKRIEPFVAWLRKHKLQGSIGELGAGWSDSASGTSSAGWQIALDTALEYCHDEGLPVYAWGAGSWFSRPYELSLEPVDGLPAPQWQVLQRYLAPPTELPPLGVPDTTATPLG